MRRQDAGRSFALDGTIVCQSNMYWYDKIHAYKNLIKLKEGTKKFIHKSRVIKFSKKHNIKNPHQMTIEECKAGL